MLLIYTVPLGDVNPPVIINCPQPVSYTVLPPGHKSIRITWIEPTATDDSGASPTVSQSHRPGDLFFVGSTKVEYAFTDREGNQARCSFIIVIGKPLMVECLVKM